MAAVPDNADAWAKIVGEYELAVAIRMHPSDNRPPAPLRSATLIVQPPSFACLLLLHSSSQFNRQLREPFDLSCDVVHGQRLSGVIRPACRGVQPPAFSAQDPLHWYPCDLPRMRTQLNDHALQAQPRQVEEHQKKEKQAGNIKNPTLPDRDVVRPRTPYVGAPGELSTRHNSMSSMIDKF
jgi:hypothetical protein